MSPIPAVHSRQGDFSSRCRLSIIGILLLLHGAGWILVNRPQLARSDAAAPDRRGVLELRFFGARTPTAAAAVKRKNTAPPVPRTRLRVDSIPVAQVAAMPSPPPAPAAATPIAPSALTLDIDALRQLARVNERGNGHGNEAADNEATGKGRAQEAALTRSDLAAQAIAKAARPKCDNDYTPAIGAVKFTGLMKLPALTNGVVRDSGCKW